MKKVFVLAILMSISFGSCSVEQSNGLENEITEADLFVSSEEFQFYQKELKNKLKEVGKIVKSLSQQEKKELQDLYNQLENVGNMKELLKIEQRIGYLLKIDFDDILADLFEIHQNLFEGITLSDEAVLKAIQRYNCSHYNLSLTRSVEEFVDNNCTYLAEDIYAAVYDGCMKENGGYEYYEMGYYGSNTYAKQRYLEVSRMCHDLAMIEEMKSYEKCINS